MRLMNECSSTDDISEAFHDGCETSSTLDMIILRNFKKEKRKNHSTQDSRVVPHRGTNWAAL